LASALLARKTAAEGRLCSPRKRGEVRLWQLSCFNLIGTRASVPIPKACVRQRENA
jgi:hypothetical protein